MLESLKFVKGAVSTKTFEPVLKHFQIKDGHVQSYNGVLSLSSPIDCDLDVKPLAAPFVHAIQLCDETVSLHLTETGRLAIKSGNFKAFIECSDEPFPDIACEGEKIEIQTGLLETLNFLAPIMGTDASRLWSHGILLANQSAYVTNNIILVEKWLGGSISTILGLPAACVKELIRINTEPSAIESNGKTVTFRYADGRWLSSLLLNISQWPDPNKLFQNENKPSPIDASLFEALEKLRPFTGDLNSVWLHADGTISTSRNDEQGAHLQLTKCKGMRGRYSADQLLKLKEIATGIDWSSYPKPCIFYGDNLRGLIIGLIDADG